jgi:hypothetical protein
MEEIPGTRPKVSTIFQPVARACVLQIYNRAVHLSFYAVANHISLAPCFSWVFNGGRPDNRFSGFPCADKPLKRF